jgi:hypothetical protein
MLIFNTVLFYLIIKLNFFKLFFNQYNLNIFPVIELRNKPSLRISKVSFVFEIHYISYNAILFNSKINFT